MHRNKKNKLFKENEAKFVIENINMQRQEQQQKRTKQKNIYVVDFKFKQFNLLYLLRIFQ